MNNSFYNPGDLNGSAFKPAGDLNGSAFKPAGDLNTQSNSFKFNQSENLTADEIKSYIDSVQTGTKTVGLTSSGGSMIVPFDSFKDMVNNGYNIIKANYFEQMGLVEVEFDVLMNSRTR